MRKIIVLSMITLDGVMQAPGGPEEDTSGGFKYGGWVAPYGDDVIGKVINKQMKPADLLLGRKTFEIFASYWPEHENGWPGINDVTKYVMSRTKKKSDWKNSVFIKNVDDVKNLKNSEGSGIHVHGSGNLVQTLLKNDLVDRTMAQNSPNHTWPREKIVEDGTIAAAFTLTDSLVTPNSVIFANYKRAGEVKTGNMEA